MWVLVNARATVASPWRSYRMGFDKPDTEIELSSVVEDTLIYNDRLYLTTARYTINGYCRPYGCRRKPEYGTLPSWLVSGSFTGSGRFPHGRKPWIEDYDFCQHCFVVKWGQRYRHLRYWRHGKH
jgi:hypothetical protein